MGQYKRSMVVNKMESIRNLQADKQIIHMLGCIILLFTFAQKLHEFYQFKFND